MIPNDAKVSHWRLWSSLVGTIACWTWDDMGWYVSGSAFGYLIAFVACIVVWPVLRWLLILVSFALYCLGVFYALAGPGGRGDIFRFSLFYIPSIVLLVCECFGQNTQRRPPEDCA